MITVVSMSRRPDKYRHFVEHMEREMGTLIDAYYVFINDPQTLPFYKNLELQEKKIRIFNGPEDFVFRYGHDTVYNYLEKNVKSTFILKLFDTDTVEVDPILLEEELKTGDIFGMETYMERGDVTETKWQLYRAGILSWYGLVHENQHFYKDVPVTQKLLKSLKVYHHNALDSESATLIKNEQGFIILKKTTEGTDSDRRNLLYETLTWKIVNEGGRHDHVGWFQQHYAFNRETVDWYYERARKKYKL
jgi:hypothetical protein